MTKPDTANRPNKGQDENLHVYQRRWRRAPRHDARISRDPERSGFRKPEDDATEPVEPTVEDPI